MQRHVLAWAVSLVAVGTACSTILGLDHVDRVACVEDCGVLGGDDGGPAGPESGTNDGPDGSVPVPCVNGACDGGYCDLDAGVCRPGCSANEDCTDPADPLCDMGDGVCVPCLPTSDTCPSGTFCAPLNGAYTCTQGCATAADCTQDAGDGSAATAACCDNACTNTANDSMNCNGCGMVCGGATPTCDDGACAYAIGGTLAGLPSGDSVVLLDNGGNALTLMANGAYKFTTPVVTGHPYDVTIMTAPASEVCAVAGGMGTVLAADVTTANVTCMSCYVAGSKAFAYTGAEQSWTVPCGVTSVTIAAEGAQGAANGDGDVAGALGGSASITFAVSAGEVLEVFVGGAGSGTAGGYNGGGSGGVGTTTTNGGGGGGASDVRTSPYALGNRVVVAAGGGGAGGDRIDATGPGAGGGGGGGYFGGGGGESYGGNGGGPGTPSAGGAAGCGAGCTTGSPPSTCGIAGVSGAGGAGGGQGTNDQVATQLGGAAGAGGGATGASGVTGGPCGTNFAGGGGGGGSSYAPGGSTSAGVHSGNGAVSLTW